MKCVFVAAASVAVFMLVPSSAVWAQVDSPVKDQTALLDAPAPSEEAVPSLGRMIPGYTYFNKPGADLKIHDAEVADCAAEAARTKSFDESIKTGAGQGVLGAVLGSAIQSAYHRGAVASGLENCMVVRGWRVVKVPDAEGEALAKLPAADLSKALDPWVGAPVPHGRVVRVWTNDAANSATQRYVLRPAHTNNGQLSLLEATSGDLHQFEIAATPIESQRGDLDPKWPKKALTIDTLPSAPGGSAIVMIQIKGLSMHNGIGIYFNRVGTDKDIFPSRTDHGPDAMMVLKGTLFAHKEGDMFVLAVPPGKWRIMSMGIGPVLSFCLGSPSFQANADEIVYAGSFDLGAADLGPNLDMAPAKAWFGSKTPAFNLRPAVYTNGSRFLCTGNHIYALEVKGAPFEPGYTWGSAAASAAQTAAPAAAAATPPQAAAQ